MAELESIKDTVLIRDKVYEMLRKEILLGGFQPGEALNILSISKQMGVSCAPIREALNMLNKDGLVELMPYKKATVAYGTAADYNTAFDLRTMMEPYAIEHSIDKIPAEEISKMHLSLQQVYDHPDSLPAFFDSDMAFHRMLYAYMESKLLVSTLDNVRSYTSRYYTRRFNMIVEQARKKNGLENANEASVIRDETKEHLTILDAVERRNAAQAASLLREHIGVTAELFQ